MGVCMYLQNTNENTLRVHYVQFICICIYVFVYVCMHKYAVTFACVFESFYVYTLTHCNRQKTLKIFSRANIQYAE